MLYSKSTGGFYSREIHGDNIPTDAVEISEAEHLALLEGQSQGKLIQADSSGNPMLIDPPIPPIQIPQSVTRREMKLALLDEGLLDDVELAIADSGDRALQINWQEALDFKRDNPLVLGVAVMLKKTDEDIDNLFLKAKSFE